MGFGNTSSSFTRFRSLDALDDKQIFNIPDNLKKFAFKDIDDLPEMRSFGWVNFDDFLDPAWTVSPPQKGEYFVFSLRLDTRRIPAGVVKKHLILAMREEKSRMSENQNFISRERKKEIREQVMLKLRQRFLPVPAVFDVIWNIRKNEIWFASTQEKMLDLFMECFLATFNAHLEQLGPAALAEGIAGDSGSDRLEALEPAKFI